MHATEAVQRRAALWYTGSNGRVQSSLYRSVLCVDEAALVQAAHALADLLQRLETHSVGHGPALLAEYTASQTVRQETCLVLDNQTTTSECSVNAVQ